MATSRDIILNKLKNAHHIDVSRPDIPVYSIPGDKLDNFKRKLSGFDGKSIEFQSREDAISWLKQNIDMTKNVYSNVEEFDAPLSAASLTDPHDAHIIDICIAEGEWGVGETGSIWVTDKSLGLAAAALLSTDLFLFLEKKNIVGGIQEAYEKIDITAQNYGSFFSGPSATADIEAVRVTGAQGEISLTALLY